MKNRMVNKLSTFLIMGLFFAGISGPIKAADVRQTSPTNKTIRPVKTTTQATVRSVSPNSPVLTAGVGAVTVTVSGTNLDLVTAVQVLKDGRVSDAVKAQLGTASGTSCQVTLAAGSSAAAGTYTIRLLAGTRVINVPTTLATVSVKKPNPVSKKPFAASGIVAQQNTSSDSVRSPQSKKGPNQTQTTRPTGSITNSSRQRVPKATSSQTNTQNKIIRPQVIKSGPAVTEPDRQVSRPSGFLLPDGEKTDREINSTLESYDALKSRLNRMTAQMNQGRLSRLSPSTRDRLKEISSKLGRGEPVTKFEGEWIKVVDDLAVDDPNLDINSLIQVILHDSYLEMSKNLTDYADKVKHFSEMKRNIRDQISRARREKARALQESKTENTEIDYQIKTLESQLEKAGDDAQLANIDLQNVLQKQQQILQTMSNVSKMLHDTAMAVIRKIG